MRFIFYMTKPFSILIILTAFIVFFSCKKKDDTSILGLDVQPEIDLLGVTITDTASVFMHTQRVDSVRSYGDQYKFIGSTQDPIFGQTHASLYTNFSIANNLTNVSFGTNPVVDSAEIVIRFLGQHLGDTATKLNYQVYLLNEKLDGAKAYYSNNTVPTSPASINTTKPARFEGRGDGLYLIIPINNTLAQYIIQTNNNLTNNTAFQNAYKGLYITTVNSLLPFPGSGAIRRYDLDDILSGLKVYYRDGNSVSSKGENTLFTFRGTDALRFNHINHKYAAGATQNLFAQLGGDSLKGKNNIYLNCFGGTRIKVFLPFLKNFSDSVNVSINRAELILKVDEAISPFSANYTYPTTLALIASDENGNEELVWDQLETSDFIKYGGNYNATEKTYTFNIARQMQRILNGNSKNYGFYLVNATPNRAFTIKRDDRYQRVVFGGKDNITYKPIFKVTYVKFPYDK